MMLKGMTVRYLLRATYKVKRGETILLHAAAGGVGQILCQWAKALGATVIGTVGSDGKACGFAFLAIFPFLSALWTIFSLIRQWMKSAPGEDA